MSKRYIQNTAKSIGTLPKHPLLGFAQKGTYQNVTSHVSTLLKSPLLGFAQKGTYQ